MNDSNEFQNTYPAYPAQHLPPPPAAPPQLPVYPSDFFSYPLPAPPLSEQRSHVQLVTSSSLFLQILRQWPDYSIILSFFFVGFMISFLGGWDDSPVRTPELNAYFDAIWNVTQVLALGGSVVYFFLRWLGGKFLRVIAATSLAAIVVIFFGSILEYDGTLILPNRISWTMVISVSFALLYTGIRLFTRLKTPLPLPKKGSEWE